METLMQKAHKNKNRKSFFYWLAIIFLGSLIAYFAILRPQQKYYYEHHITIQGVYLLKPIALDAFELTDHNGNSFTKDNLKKHWTLIYFGFTQCNLACPTTLQSLNKTYQILKKQMPTHALPQIVFVTLDPKHDSLEKMKNYITSFNSHFIGARTTQEKTETIKNIFHISAENNQDIINHSTRILLINPNAQIQAYFSYPPNAEKMANDYFKIINNQPLESKK
jgi:protein SCO1/2